MKTDKTREKALKWWKSVGPNPLMRVLIQGELCAKHYGQFRMVRSLKDDEIVAIYLDFMGN